MLRVMTATGKVDYENKPVSSHRICRLPRSLLPKPRNDGLYSNVIASEAKQSLNLQILKLTFERNIPSL